jgi:hypothetical protein
VNTRNREIEGDGGGEVVYGPRLLALSSLRRCMVRTILLGGFYLCVNLSACILELKLCPWSKPVH